MVQLTDRNRFSIIYPEVAVEWHPTKNGDLTPNDIACKSGKKFWWLCSKDDCKYEWKSVVCKRTKYGNGCPACSGQVITDRNRLSIIYSEVAVEWHPTKNGDLTPNDVSFGSNKKISWLCSKDDCRYEWNVSVNSRINYRTGCPACAGRVVTDRNRLSIIYPEVAVEWHPTKNGDLTPNDVSFGSHKKIIWLCSKDDCKHEWKTTVKDRTINYRTGCPACSGRVVTDRNRLSITHPEVAAEWHPTKNGDLTPNDVSFGSVKKISWLCSKDDCRHEWDASVYSRTKGHGCPACSGRVLTDRNRLSIIDPEVAADWHPTKNGDLTPNDVSFGSSKKIWWLCSKDDCKYEWDTPVNDRTNGGNGCSGCSGQVVTDRNRLSIIDPEVAAEWHPTKNGDLTPNDVSFGSSKKIWWLCSKDDCRHEWDALVSNRTKGAGCSVCAKYGFNPSIPSYLYLISRPNQRKVGIYNEGSDRLNQHAKNGWKFIQQIGPFCGEKIKKIETEVLRALKNKGILMGRDAFEEEFDGFSESWQEVDLDVKSLNDLFSYLHVEPNFF